MSELDNKILHATKWASITQVIAKLITPITSMVLARLLTPEAFGIVATLTMIISFAEIFTDAGFQKYLIQHNFSDEVDRDQCTNVAFWSNLIMSLLIWLIIGIFSEQLATMVGSPGLGNVLTIACISIPLAAFSSIQMALYKRDMDFKTLFKVRIIGICVPLVVTIPLAIIIKNFWALVIGTIASNVVNAVLLTVYSKWKPRLYYSFVKLKEMLSFTIWSLFEAISIWLTSYLDIFIVGAMLNQYYLGIYRTATATVGGIVGIVTAATTPVLFSALSRLQNDDDIFNKTFFKFQKNVGILVVPIGMGIFVFSEFITNIMLGKQWTDAVSFVGLWGLMSTITILFSHYASEVYRSKGRPMLSFIAQWLHIIVLVPVVYIYAKEGYEQLYVARSLVRLQSVIVDCSILYLCFKISTWKMIKNVLPEFCAGTVMMVAGFMLKQISNDVFLTIIFILICGLIYFVVLILFRYERRVVFNTIGKLLNK